MMPERKATRRTCTRLQTISITAALLISSVAQAVDFSPSEVRISTAGDKFDGVTQIAVTAKTPTPEIFGAHHAEYSFGAMFATGESEIFASYGPVWRLPVSESDLFVDLGIAATLISGTRFEGREIGGHFHFTSSVSIGKRFGRTQYFALRIQHLSNAGLNGTNPGMDMIGLEFSLGF